MNELVLEKKNSTAIENNYKYLSKVKEQFMQCISCGDCREAVDYSSDPQKWGTCVVREHTAGFEPFFGRGKMQIIRSIWEGKLGLSKELAEIFFQCTTCNACSLTCFFNVDNAACYEALRAELVEAKFGLDAHRSMNKNLIELNNPYGRDNKEKNEWTNRLDFKIKNAMDEMTDILYFVGCTAALTPEIQNVAINTAKVLNNMGIDFTILGEHEICCGSVAMRTGDRSAFIKAAMKNVEIIKKCGTKIIITSCAGCYRTLKIDYADFFEKMDIEVMHIVEFLIKYVNDNKISLKNLNTTATFHDPCHSSRHLGLYEEPRELLRKMTNLIEMKTVKENAKCCGAGGGVKKGFSELSLEIAKSRIKEAEETGSEYIVSICPFCERNLYDAIQALQSVIKVVDLIELLIKALN
ncbi:MAG: (Fe-S)-binding protein [Candidatus Hodarchaeota archaeon]